MAYIFDRNKLEFVAEKTLADRYGNELLASVQFNDRTGTIILGVFSAYLVPNEKVGVIGGKERYKIYRDGKPCDLKTLVYHGASAEDVANRLTRLSIELFKNGNVDYSPESLEEQVQEISAQALSY